MKQLYQYHAETGVFEARANETGEWVKIADGYSGTGAGRNNPALEAKRSLGPIPRGDYLIGKPIFSDRVGPVSMHLTPIGHTAHGRSAFMIHGDNTRRDASRGCIILPRPVREEIAKTWRELEGALLIEVV